MTCLLLIFSQNLSFCISTFFGELWSVISLFLLSIMVINDYCCRIYCCFRYRAKSCASQQVRFLRQCSLVTLCCQTKHFGVKLFHILCIILFSLPVAAAYSYFNLGESSSSSDDEDYSPEDWKKVMNAHVFSVKRFSCLISNSMKVITCYKQTVIIYVRLLVYDKQCGM